LYSCALRDGLGVATNPTAARELLLEHLDSGLAACHLAYGQMLEWGEGGPADAPEALRQYAKAAEADNSEALYFQGHALINGIGTPQRLEQGVELLKRAAQRNEAKAHLLLCFMRSSYLRSQWTQIKRGKIVDGRPPTAPRVKLSPALEQMKVPPGEHELAMEPTITASLQVARDAHLSGAAELWAAWKTQESYEEINADEGETTRSASTELERRLLRVIADQTRVPFHSLHRGTHFARDLAMDSLAQTELVMNLEEEFGCSIPDEDVVRLTTIGMALDYAKSKFPVLKASTSTRSLARVRPAATQSPTGGSGCLILILVLGTICMFGY
jgi:acyl carrier protein